MLATAVFIGHVEQLHTTFFIFIFDNFVFNINKLSDCVHQVQTGNLVGVQLCLK